MHFYSFISIQYKRNLVRVLFYRARRIRFEDTIQMELEFLRTTVASNGYPDAFVTKYSKMKTLNSATATASKQNLLIQLPFKGDDVTQILFRCTKSTVVCTYYAATTIILL